MPVELLGLVKPTLITLPSMVPFPSSVPVLPICNPSETETTAPLATVSEPVPLPPT